MASEIERLKKHRGHLQQRGGEMGTRQSEATSRIAEIEQRRRSFLAEAGEGNAGARRELKKLDSELLDARTDAESFRAAAAKINGELKDVQAQLARAERAAAIVALENELVVLGRADGEVERAIVGVKAASAGTYAATDAVTAALTAIDPVRWGSSFAGEIRRDITNSITRQLDMRPPGWPVPPKVFEMIGPRFKGVIAQLKYESGEWQASKRGHCKPTLQLEATLRRPPAAALPQEASRLFSIRADHNHTQRKFQRLRVFGPCPIASPSAFEGEADVPPGPVKSRWVWRSPHCNLC